MHKEFGSYFPIELPTGQELYTSGKGIRVERFDCGRNAIAVIPLSVNISKIYIPFYNCAVVRDTLARHNIQYEQYYLDEHLQPVVPELMPEEWLLYVNYLGNTSKENCEMIATKYKRVIFDNTQAFFAEPIIGNQVFNVYSPRKFVGVSDGAYVVWGNDLEIRRDFPLDIAWERSAFLFKSIELGTNAAYQDNLDSMKDMGKEIKKMSLLSRRILESIDYDKIKQKRRRNIEMIHEGLKEINCYPFEPTGDLMAYPFYFENDRLRELLINNKIYVSQWWKYLLDIVPENSIEAKYSKWLFPLPIDQRYSEDDITELTRLVVKCCKNTR